MLALTATSALLLLTALFASGFADFKHNPRPPVSLVGDSVPREQYVAMAKKAARRLKGWRKSNRRYLRLRVLAARQTRTDVNAAIHIASQVYGVPESAMRSVAFCESRLFTFATNGIYLGLFQMHWRPFGLSPFNPYANALSAAQTVKHDGSWRQWECKP